MSGADDLLLFEQLVNNANALFLSEEDFVVINGVTKPTLKKIYADFTASTGTFPTVEEGLRETNGSGTNNRFFTVPASGLAYEIRYRNDGGGAVEVGRVSSAEALDSFGLRLDGAEEELSPVAQAIQPDKYLTDDLAIFIDAANQVFGSVGKNAAWDILLKSLTNADGLSVFEYEAMGLSGEAAIVDANGKILAVLGGGDDSATEEIIAARGSRESLTERISQSLNAYGMPKHHVWGEWYLREIRQRLRKRALAEAMQLTVAFIGDSWTHSADRYTKAVAATLKSAYGGAGDGWVGFGRANPSLPNGNINWNGSVTYAGTWDGRYATSYSPDIAEIFSSEVGASLKYSISALTTSVNLFAQGGAGVVQYRWGGGTWTLIDLSAFPAGQQVIALANVPATAAAIEIAVVSGTPVLFGIDVKSTADGIRCHKLGATGSRSQQWAAVDQAQWVVGIKALAPNAFIIMHGTNDQPAYGPAAYKNYMRTLVARCRLANPLADILLMIPCENGRANSTPMGDFAEALYELAVEHKCAFMDLQYLFGDSFSEYASTSPRAWFNADLIHPEPQTGGRVIADGVLRLLTQL